ncbi:MAG: type II toxin-antitoxin system VapC family toxin [Nannocystaceae bacterium]
MRLLVDTHVWLWLQVAPARVDPKALALLADLENEVLMSAASAWEIAIKHALGRLPLPVGPAQYVPSRMSRSGITALPVLHAHALRVAELPPLHRDPFDRLLIAQALHERLTLVTSDRQLEAYEVPIVWA